MLKYLKQRKGFSLVELLVVVTIIAILSVTAFVALGGQTVKARDARRKQDLTTIQSALEQYYLQYSRYPASLANGEAIAPDWKIPKKYLSQIPIDPNGKPYRYITNISSYEIGAALEGDGNPKNFEAYIVGNSDTDLIKTNANSRKYNGNDADPGVVGCADNFDMDTGKVGVADADDNCIPYHPGPGGI